MVQIGLALRLRHGLGTLVLERTASVLFHFFKFIVDSLPMILRFFLLDAVVAQMPDGIVKLVDVES